MKYGHAEKNEKPKRPPPVSYRPPKDREAAFHAAVAASGLSANAFITECIFGRSRHRPAELQKLALLLAETTRIADALARLDSAGADHNALLIETAGGALAEIRAALLRAMGRLP